jgi:sortase A
MDTPTAEVFTPVSDDQAPKRRSWPIRILRGVLPLILIGLAVYIFYNFPALWQRLTYLISKPKPGNTAMLPATIGSGGTGGNTAGAIPTGGPECGSHPIDYDAAGNPKRICDNYIYIPNIRVAAPIVRPSSTAEEAINDALLKGVIKYPGTAEPGDRGNIFLTGHSSYYWWVSTEYRNVFTLVPNLINNDEIIIYYKGTRFSYRISNTFEVSPTETSILAPTPDATLTLSTCVPIGTSYRRKIVQAKQVSPDPNRTRPGVGSATRPARLPGVR